MQQCQQLHLLKLFVVFRSFIIPAMIQETSIFASTSICHVNICNFLCYLMSEHLLLWQLRFRKSVFLNVSHASTTTVALAEEDLWSVHSLLRRLRFRKHVLLILGQAAISPVTFRFQKQHVRGIRVMKHSVVPFLPAPVYILLTIPLGQFWILNVGHFSLVHN
jgi:hypothetical protein